MVEKETKELAFKLPEDVIEQLSGLALIDGKPSDPDVVAAEYAGEAVIQYLTKRKADPSFPDQLATARARMDKRMDLIALPPKPELN